MRGSGGGAVSDGGDDGSGRRRRHGERSGRYLRAILHGGSFFGALCWLLLPR